VLVACLGRFCGERVGWFSRVEFSYEVFLPKFDSVQTLSFIEALLALVDRLNME
jgi:hypothetical protein